MQDIDQKDFNALIVDCAGHRREDQEVYLNRLVMKLMIQCFGRDPRIPDGNVLRGHGLGDVEDSNEAMKILDAIYSAVSKSLLDDSNFDLYDIRSNAIKFMRSELARRHEIRDEAGV